MAKRKKTNSFFATLFAYACTFVIIFIFILFIIALGIVALIYIGIPVAIIYLIIKSIKKYKLKKQTYTSIEYSNHNVEYPSYEENNITHNLNVFCPSCGVVIDWYGKVCPYCNYEIEVTPNIYNIMLSNLKKDILMTNFLNAHIKARNINLGYSHWFYENGLNDEENYINELIQINFIKHTSKEEILFSMTNNQIKEYLRTYSLKTSGNKKDLITRLLPYVDSLDLDTKNFYILTEKGNSFIKNHTDLIDYYKYKIFSITLEEYLDSIINFNFKKSFFDNTWWILNKRFNAHLLSRENINYRKINTDLFNMAYLLSIEKKYEVALQYYIQKLYFELNAADLFGNLPSQIDSHSIIYFKDHKNYSLTISWDKNILQLSNYYSKTIAEYSINNSTYIQYKFISNEEFFRIIELYINETLDIQHVENIISKRIQNFILENEFDNIENNY